METEQNTYNVTIPDTNIVFNTTNASVEMKLTLDGNFSLIHNREERLLITKDGKFFVNGNETDINTDSDKIYEAFRDIIFNCQLSFGFIKLQDFTKYLYNNMADNYSGTYDTLQRLTSDYVQNKNE